MLKLKYLAFVTALAVTGPASAGLIGQPVTGNLDFAGFGINYFDPANGFVPAGYLNSTDPPGITVTIQEPAIEFGYEDINNLNTANFDDTTLTISDVVLDSIENTPFVMTFTFAPGLLASYNLISNSFPGTSSVSSGGDTITFSWDGGAVTTGETYRAVFEITTNAVPEPATLALMGIGLAGMMGLGKRRRVPAAAV